LGSKIGSAGIATGESGPSRTAAGNVGAVGEAEGERGVLRRTNEDIGSVSGAVQEDWLPERDERVEARPTGAADRIGRTRWTEWSGEVEVAWIRWYRGEWRASRRGR
jgi:hypothetical protein